MKQLNYLALSLLLAFCSISCTKYQRYVLPKSKLMNIDKDFLTYYLVDAAHPLTRVWYMSECKLTEKEIACHLTKLTELEAYEVYKIQSNKDARWSKNDVLFYADPRFATTIPDSTSMSITTDQLIKIEVYELNHVRTFGTPLITFAGVLSLLYLTSDF